MKCFFTLTGRPALPPEQQPTQYTDVPGIYFFNYFDLFTYFIITIVIINTFAVLSPPPYCYP